MSNEFEFTKNSAKSVVDGELIRAKANAIIEEGKVAGKSQMEIGAELFKMTPEEAHDLGKLIHITALLTQMGSAFYMGGTEEQMAMNESRTRQRNHAFWGYRAIVNHFVDSVPAKKWEAFFDNAETIGDVYRYFLQENDLTYDEASGLVGYMILDVEEILKVRLDANDGSVNFAINKIEWEALRVKDHRGMEELNQWEKEHGHKPFPNKPADEA